MSPNELSKHPVTGRVWTIRRISTEYLGNNLYRTVIDFTEVRTKKTCRLDMQYRADDQRDLDDTISNLSSIQVSGFYLYITILDATDEIIFDGDDIQTYAFSKVNWQYYEL